MTLFENGASNYGDSGGQLTIQMIIQHQSHTQVQMQVQAQA